MNNPPEEPCHGLAVTSSDGLSLCPAHRPRLRAKVVDCDNPVWQLLSMTGQDFDDAYGVALALANALMHFAAIVAQHDRELASDILVLVREHVDMTATATAFSERDRTAIASAFDLAKAAITDTPSNRGRLD